MIKNNEIKEILRSIIGHRFVSITSDFSDSGYGHIILQLNECAIDLKNEQKFQISNSKIFSDDEDVAAFSCQKYEGELKFESAIDNQSCVKTAIDEIINGVAIIVDRIYVNGDFDFDMINGITITTSDHKYVFGKRIWFSEDIFFSMDSDRCLYPIDVEQNDLSNDGEYNISVVREEYDL